MTRLLLLAWLAAILPVADARAQVTTVPVRGGEHAFYTRLVLALPPGADWQLDQDGRRGILTITGAAMRFDLTQTFARIPRTRLRDLTVRAQSLELDLACDCTLRAAEDALQLLVVDILSPTGASAQVRPRPRPAALATADASDLARRAGVTVAASLRGQTPDDGARPLPAAPLLARPPAPPLLSDSPPAPPDRAESGPDDHANTLRALGDAVAQATGQGLLVAALPAGGRADAAPVALPVTGADTAAHLTVTDSIAIARRSPAQSVGQGMAADCPDPAQLAIPSWGGAGTPGFLASPDLFDARDRPDATAIRSAARGLVYWGLGAEARLLLDLLDAPDEGDRVLRQIARAVDLDPFRSHDLRALAPCGDMGAVLAALAVMPDPFAPDFPFESALRGIAALPAHLRLHLGPSLLRHWLAQGLDGPATALRDMLARIADPAADGALRLTLDMARPAPPPPAPPPETLAPDDLMFLLRTRGRAALDQTTRDAALGTIFALRGTAQGAAIAAELAEALIEQTDFATALDVIDAPETAFDPDRREGLRAKALAQVVEQAPDINFLRLTFQQDPWQRPVPDGLAVAIAGRLRALGFSEQADALTPTARTVGQSADTAPIATPRPLPEPGRFRPDGNDLPSEGRAGATATPPGDGKDMLLGAGHATLRESAALRARLSALLPPD